MKAVESDNFITQKSQLLNLHQSKELQSNSFSVLFKRQTSFIPESRPSWPNGLFKGFPLNYHSFFLTLINIINPTHSWYLQSYLSCISNDLWYLRYPYLMSFTLYRVFQNVFKWSALPIICIFFSCKPPSHSGCIF